MRHDDSLGVDIACLDDITPRFECASGTRNLAMAIARRLRTGRGGLWYAGGYGEDMTDVINHEITKDLIYDLKTRIERQVMMDERIDTARITVIWDPQTETLRIWLIGTSRSGPYRWVMEVDQAGARIVEDA